MSTQPTDSELIAELEVSGVAFMKFRGGLGGTKEVWTTSGSQDAKKIAQGMRAAIAKWGQPAQARAGAVPLDEARRLFDAGWKAAALFCDREDVVADGIIGFGTCPQFEAAFSAAHGIKGGQHGDDKP